MSFNKMMDTAVSLEGIEKLRKKRILQVFWLSELAICLAMVHPLSTSNWLNLIMLLAFGVANLGTYFYANKDQLTIAANIVIFVNTLLVLAFTWVNQGVRDEVLLVFPAVVAFAVLTGSHKLTKPLSILILLNIALMGILHELQLYRFEVAGAGISSAFVIVVICYVVFYSIYTLGSDITAANKLLYDHQINLEQTVKERTKDLEASIASLTKAQKDLVEAEKMASLGRLVGGIAHEVNTPIGVAVTATSVINDSNKGLQKLFDENTMSRSALAEHLNIVNQSSELITANLQRASELVSDFKEVAVLREAEDKTLVNLHEEVLSIIYRIQPETERENYRVSVQCQQVIEAKLDKVVLLKVLENLYANSCKHGFNNTEGDITIKLSSDSRIVTLVYQDNGAGIKTDDQPHIFEPFFTTRRGGGTGLGLHIVFNLVTQSLAGQITYDASYTDGARFIITFPQLF